jgi:hypothetical protein
VLKSDTDLILPGSGILRKDMDTITKRALLAERQEEVRKLADEIRREEHQCQHKFGTPVYDPIEEPNYEFSHYEGHGSDPEPVHRVAGTKTTPRWKQVCSRCGRTEFTQKTKPPVGQHVPDFG